MLWHLLKEIRVVCLWLAAERRTDFTLNAPFVGYFNSNTATVLSYH